MLLCYKLLDQEALQVHQVKAHDVRAFAAFKTFQGGVSLEQTLCLAIGSPTTSSLKKPFKTFQGGVSLEQILFACHWKSHNTFTQFYLKDVAWTDSEIYHLGLTVAAQQICHC